MSERKNIDLELAHIEKDLRELQIRYEKYFSGTEKLEPLQERESLARRLRNFANRRIVQTDLRFRYQNLASRFHSYAGHWDRILRLMDEGRFIRGGSGLPLAPPKAAKAANAAASSPPDEVERLVRQLRESGGERGQSEAEERQKVARFLEAQREKIKETFGEQEVEFRVVIEGGKPKIKVRAKK